MGSTCAYVCLSLSMGKEWHKTQATEGVLKTTALAPNNTRAHTNHPHTHTHTQ